jgi:CRP-like cAMP-binding protein
MHSPTDRVSKDSLILKKISSYIDLTDSQRDVLLAVAQPSERAPKGSILAETGLHQRQATFVLSGWALRQTFLKDGRRHIAGFILPGDPLFPFSFMGEDFCEEIVAVTPMVLANLGARPNQPGRPALPDLMPFHLAVARQHLHFARNHMIRLGRYDGQQRIGHLLLEIFERLSDIGWVSNDSFAFPLTQEMLGDALGLSTIHVNRSMMQLRDLGLVRKAGGRVHLPDIAKLSAQTEYVAVDMANDRLPRR